MKAKHVRPRDRAEWRAWLLANHDRVDAVFVAFANKPSRAVVPDAMPVELAKALRRSAAARKSFDALAPSHQRNWQRWIHDAQQVETRERRAAKAIAQLASGHKDPWRA